MIRSTVQVARLCVAGALATFPLFSAAPVAAVTPPPVDDSMLPKPGPPAPPRPTEQQERCAAAPPADAQTAAAGQLSGLDLKQVWEFTRGAGQTVAVIDTGVARHRLLPHLVPGGDYVYTGDGTDDCDGHGTVVAGIVGAQPDSGRSTFSGIAPDATIVSIRQSSNRFRATDDPSGSGFGDVDTLAKAVRTAADMGATVINVSSVACLPADGGLDDRPLGAALAYAVDVKNVVVVAAAGNVGGPGQCPEQNPATDPAQARATGLGPRERRRQSGLVRRLRVDRRIGRPAWSAVGVQSRRAVGGCRSAGRRHRVLGSRRRGPDE